MESRTPHGPRGARLSRRTLMAGMLGIGAGAAGVTPVGNPAWAAHGQGKGRFDQPMTEYTSYQRLKDGKPNQVQLDADALERGWSQVVSFTEPADGADRSEEHTSELQSRFD